VNRLRHVFKWAVENELIPPAVHQGLAAVKGLQVGRSEAKESDPVEAVAEGFVDCVVNHLSPHIGAMVRLQILSGMRSGEVCGIRGCDVETSGKIWVYRPPRHKNAHRGHKRVIHLGPQAQKVLEPFLKPDTQAYLFSPADAERERREKRRAAREADGTPLSCGNRPGSNVATDPKKSPGLRYDVVAYCKAVYAGCDKAFPLPDDLARGRVKSATGKERTRWETPAEWRTRLGGRWGEAEKWIADHRFHPHQLRHSAATKLRKEYGLEAARVVLGHKSLAITETYAEIDQGKASEIMGRVG
jgi:integrase